MCIKINWKVVSKKKKTGRLFQKNKLKGFSHSGYTLLTRIWRMARQRLHAPSMSWQDTDAFPVSHTPYFDLMQNDDNEILQKTRNSQFNKLTWSCYDLQFDRPMQSVFGIHPALVTHKIETPSEKYTHRWNFKFLTWGSALSLDCSNQCKGIYLDPAHVKDCIVVSNPVGHPRFSWKGRRQIGTERIARGTHCKVENTQILDQIGGTGKVSNPPDFSSDEDAEGRRRRVS
jgi:hypothetical protein